MHKKLPHLIYSALATNYFNVFMSTTVFIRTYVVLKNWRPVDFGEASDFSNLLAPFPSGPRSLMLRAAVPRANFSPPTFQVGFKFTFSVVSFLLSRPMADNFFLGISRVNITIDRHYDYQLHLPNES